LLIVFLYQFGFFNVEFADFQAMVFDGVKRQPLAEHDLFLQLLDFLIEFPHNGNNVTRAKKKVNRKKHFF
jgi:hypothetical protein